MSLRLTPLEDRITPAPLTATADGGTVTLADSVTGDEERTLTPFPGFTGPVSVALADFNRDGTPDLVAGAGAGGPHVKVVDGATGDDLLSFFAFDPSFRGGVSVGAGDVTNDGTADVLVGAGPGGGPHVKAFDGETGEELLSFFAYEPAFTGGVSVAAGDFKFDGFADVVVGAGKGGGPHVQVFDGRGGGVLGGFFAYDAAFRGGVNVAAADLNADGAVELITGAGPGGGPHVRVFGGVGMTDDGSFLAGDGSSRGGVSVAAADATGDARDDILAATAEAVGLYRGTSLELLRSGPGASAVAGTLARGAGTDPAVNNPVAAGIPDVERLGVYNPANGSFESLEGYTIPAGAKVYVAAHGWAPGYKPWVDAYAARTGGVLKWWQTNPDDTSYDGQDNADDLAAAGSFLFAGTEGVSADGLAKVLHDLDPAAVILAFSWIDQSATENAFFNEIPHDANLSEAHTAVNGLRLARAVRSVLPANFLGGGGTLHLIGHSHGSKVVTTGAVALQRFGIPPTQLTTLDSPEAGFATDVGEAVNFNWYFLQDLNTARSGGTLVDNYVSEFGSRYSDIDFPNLANVVDVNLDPLLYSSVDLSDRHGYAPAFYVGTSEVGGEGGVAFNPSVAGTLDAAYTQAWKQLPRDKGLQFVLDEAEAFPPTATVTPEFDAVDFVTSESTGDVDFDGGAETVTMSGASTWVGYFNPGAGSEGMTFEYEFLTEERGQLSLSVNGDLVFVVDAEAAGQLPQRGTLSVTTFIGDPLCNRYLPSLTCQSVTLALAGASGASVRVSDFRTLSI